MLGSGQSEFFASATTDPGLLPLDDGEPDEALRQFIQAIAKHRHFEREVDPPGIWPLADIARSERWRTYAARHSP